MKTYEMNADTKHGFVGNKQLIDVVYTCGLVNIKIYGLLSGTCGSEWITISDETMSETTFNTCIAPTLVGAKLVKEAQNGTV